MSTDLVAFLNARLDQDERCLPGYFPSPWSTPVDRSQLDKPLGDVDGGYLLQGSDGVIVAERVRGNAIAHLRRYHPARMRAEIEAKRRIIAIHGAGADPCDAHDGSFETIPCDTLLLLALPYADDPDYREEWRP